MSEIFVVWATDQLLATARAAELRAGRENESRILLQGNFSLVQAEDLTTKQGMDSNDAAYCYIIEVGLKNRKNREKKSGKNRDTQNLQAIRDNLKPHQSN